MSYRKKTIIQYDRKKKQKPYMSQLKIKRTRHWTADIAGLKPSGKYQVKKCGVCRAKFLLGPLDPDVDVCPLHAYQIAEKTIRKG